MDASFQHIQELVRQEYYWMHGLHSITSFIDRKNINDIINKENFNGKIGVLSIDLDGNDYWVWDAIDACQADVVVCEYNGLFGDLHPICVPYAPDFDRFQAHYSGRYFGASLPAIRLMAENKGYDFVGTTSTGHNAFFVHRSVSSNILPLIGKVQTFPSRSRHTRSRSGELEFHNHVMNVFHMLGELPVINVESGKEVSLKEIVRPYSDAWAEYLS